MQPPPDPAALARLAAELGRDATIDSVRELRGGLGAAMHSFRLRSGTDTRRLVLRRYLQPVLEGSRRTVAYRAWRTLAALERLCISAPRPIWLDSAITSSHPPTAYLFRYPALVMSFVPGRTGLRPTNIESWIDQLAAALVRIHHAPAISVDLTFLPGPGETARRIIRQASRRSGLSRDPDGQAALACVRRLLLGTKQESPVLVHGDFWAGNTLSQGARVTAVVDWDSAAIDQPALDVGYCRMDLAMLGPAGAPDAFLHAYERRAGRPITNLPFWDLLAALRALPDPERWLPGYHALERTDITAAGMSKGLHAFIAGALRRAE